jgi:hypothetical protein
MPVGRHRPMEDDDEAEVLARYVWRFCQHLMTDVERRADRFFVIETKARWQEERGHEEFARELRARFSHECDEEIRAMLADGHEAFRDRVIRRLLADPAVQAMINRCPKCRRVVRTPEARQCLWCNHVWREQRR